MQRDERSGSQPGRDGAEKSQERTVDRSLESSDGHPEIASDEKVDLTLDSPDGYPWISRGEDGRVA